MDDLEIILWETSHQGWLLLVDEKKFLFISHLIAHENRGQFHFSLTKSFANAINFDSWRQAQAYLRVFNLEAEVISGWEIF